MATPNTSRKYAITTLQSNVPSEPIGTSFGLGLYDLGLTRIQWSGVCRLVARPQAKQDHRGVIPRHRHERPAARVAQHFHVAHLTVDRHPTPLHIHRQETLGRTAEKNTMARV